MRSAKVLSACLLGAALSSGGHAEVYRWVDAEGKVHFGDRKPAKPQTKDHVNDKNLEIREISAQLRGTNVDASGAELRKLEKVFARESAAEQRYRQQQNAAEEPDRDCRQARGYWRTVQGPVSFKRSDGSVYSITEKERQALAEQVQSYLQRNCR